MSPFHTVYFPTPNCGRDTAGLGDAAAVSAMAAGDELASGGAGAEGVGGLSRSHHRLRSCFNGRRWSRLVDEQASWPSSDGSVYLQWANRQARPDETRAGSAPTSAAAADPIGTAARPKRESPIEIAIRGAPRQTLVRRRSRDRDNTVRLGPPLRIDGPVGSEELARCFPHQSPG